MTITKTTTAAINHRSGNKAPLHCEKHGGVWDHKLVVMVSDIKMIGHTNLGSENYGIQKRHKETMVTVIKHHCSGKKPWGYYQIVIHMELLNKTTCCNNKVCENYKKEKLTTTMMIIIHSSDKKIL